MPVTGKVVATRLTARVPAPAHAPTVGNTAVARLTPSLLGGARRPTPVTPNPVAAHQQADGRGQRRGRFLQLDDERLRGNLVGKAWKVLEKPARLLVFRAPSRTPIEVEQLMM